MSDPERWRAVKTWFEPALDRPEASRASWLRNQGLDDDLIADIVSLVGAHQRSHSFLEAGALDLPGAAEVVREATTSFAEAALAAGARLGPYEVVRAIGEGGMGTVYLATRADDAFDKQVAIKLVRAGSLNARLADRLRQERRVLAALDHPNIARLIDGGSTPGGVPYVVMEYVDGVPIDAYCEQHQVPIVERLRLIQSVCQAVQHAHGHLIVHRDIKASNVLVTEDGAPKLLDFGIAKVLAEHAPGASVTGFGALTPESASPEQLRNEPVTVSTDVYSLGLLLYRLTTGRPPFPEALSQMALAVAIAERDPDAPSRVAEPGLARQLPRDLDLIVARALRREPDRRYDSARALADDIERLLTSRPVMAAPDSAPYRMRRFATRHRAGVAASLAGAIALTAGLAATLWQSRVANLERARAERRFDDVRRLATTVIFDLHDAVAPLAGSTRARGIIIRSALDYLDSLANEAAGDLSLQREMAAAYERLATVQGRPGVSNLGDRQAAHTSFVKAQQVRERLVSDSRSTAADRVALARLYYNVAPLEDRATGAARVAAGLDILDHLPQEEAEERSAQSLRASLLFTRGGAWADRKDYPAAKRDYAAAVEVYERLLASDVDRQPEGSRNLSIGLKSLGSVLWMLDDHAGAVVQYRRALDLDQARLATQTDNAEWKLDLSFSLASLAFAELNQHQGAEAVRHYQQSLELREDVWRDDPSNEQAQDAVARAHQTLADAYLQTGRTSDAIAAASRAVDLRERWRKAQPADPIRRARLAVALGSRYDARRRAAERLHGSAARAAWLQARADIVRIAALQDEARQTGAETIPGLAPGLVADEIARCNRILSGRRTPTDAGRHGPSG